MSSVPFITNGYVRSYMIYIIYISVYCDSRSKIIWDVSWKLYVMN